ncbi:FAD-binding and (Fe-S)-binding domain-containing protein [Limnoglobus roseus]|uniref:FAD-binding oxidoreductase n=1 Tax=Limnoglobus roseus TaxID=2598579 RepID=A0A5C1A7L4_9BACT|nr:FAD-binding and (Fe-S)-binding domain-containing protein [Limnoglobus roseus]QEL13832.1 FAD-binding oxidoreductase [Limnoglobus roseus]
MSNFAAVRHDSLVRYLARHVTGEVRFDDTSRRLYATDASHYQIPPLGVVIPKTEEDVLVAVQIAADLSVPITARGGGTSLSGQSIGPGIVLDCSKYLNRVGEIDAANRTVRVQPGVVLDQLNRELAPHNLFFGPDVATASRATIGGMIGNNSAGSRSIRYGKTIDHVRSLSAILSDGTRTTFGPLTATEKQRKLERRDREGDIYRTVERVVTTNADEIDRRFPKIVRRVSGYNLADVKPNTLVPLIVGSEGTLAVVSSAELSLVPKPVHRGLLVPQFDSLRAALDALAVCLEFKPSAVELMDELLLNLARQQRSLKHAMGAIHGTPAAVLMVEFITDTASEAAALVEKLSAKLRGAKGLTVAVTANDPQLRDPLWNLRSAAVPLLYGMAGDGKPITFCEDTAVSPEKLPEFATRFREIFHKHGTDGTFYGHASVGCLHIRPVLNLHDPGDVVRMRAIMTDVTDLVLEFGGSLSGEHGDGLVRSEWNRKMFGDAIYDGFRDIKRAFDPTNVLNPGKVVNGPAMEENLRFTPGHTVAEPPTVFNYEKQGGFFRSIELCNGAGVCRKTQGGSMCPSYRATMDERDSTRGRANALRLALSAERGVRNAEVKTESFPPHAAIRASHSALEERWVADVMDLCLSCKACKAECPSNVDVAKLKAEWQQAYYRRRPRPVGHLMLKNIDWLSPLASQVAGPLNWFGRRSLIRRVMQWSTGFDRRRSLPEFHRQHFRRWFSKRSPLAARRSVVLLDDCFTTYQEPHIGRAAVEVLEKAGYSVQLANVCCGRAMISKGFLTAAQGLAERGIAKLIAAADAGVPILGLEPSCVLTLADEWPELVPGDAAKRVAASAFLIESWLANEIAEKKCELLVRAKTSKALFHGHCHQKALVGVGGTQAALKLVPDLAVTTLDAGCCGMAGAFGYEEEHYDLSVKIAGLQLLPALAADPAAAVIATGTSCRHQIRDLTGRHAVHPIELFTG